MTTAQEVLADAIPPFPFFIENPVDLHRDDLPANKANNIPNPSYVSIDTSPLPDRCQFTFSDGRQCTMARSDIHPSLCRFHSEREEQLFGDPAPGGPVVGRALDLPELYSACRDLTTAAGVNRALAQVFRLLAQRRISRQEAATFGHLAQLLLRSISAARAESAVIPVVERQKGAFPRESPAANVYQSRRNVYQQDELSPQHKVELRGVNKVPLSPPDTVQLTPVPEPHEPAASPKVPAPSPGTPNSPTMSTYEITGLKPVHNEHLQKWPQGVHRAPARGDTP